MGVPMGVNSRRNDLPIERRLGWDGAIALALSVIVAVFFIVGVHDGLSWAWKLIAAHLPGGS